MAWQGVKHSKHCRWCGTAYYAAQPIGRDGFHSKVCKQAHYRAFKKYVTTRADLAALPSAVRRARR